MAMAIIIIAYIFIAVGCTVLGISLGMICIQWLASSAIANTDFLDD